MITEDYFVNKCIEHGAYKAFIISVDKIPLDKDLRNYCEVNYCGSYGKNYACPPSVGSAEELIEKAKTYNKALVFQTVTNLEDSYDFEGMSQAALKHSKIADAITNDVKNQFSNYLLLTAGGCAVCAVCAQVDAKPCRLPEKATSSLEAYCMNVSTLAELCNMNYINGQNTVTYFGAFLFN